MGNKQTIVGVLGIAVIGVVTVAAIFQLSKANHPLTTAGQSVSNNALNQLFKAN